MEQNDLWDWPAHCKLTFFDAFYFIFTTVSTIGFGDIYPETPSARVVVIIIMATLMLVLPPELSKLSDLIANSSVYSRFLLSTHVCVGGRGPSLSLALALSFSLSLSLSLSLSPSLSNYLSLSLSLSLSCFFFAAQPNRTTAHPQVLSSFADKSRTQTPRHFSPSSITMTTESSECRWSFSRRGNPMRR